MKKILAIILALVMIVGATFTMSSCAEEEKDVLICGVTPLPGFSEKDEKGNYVSGFDTEFALAVGEILGMEVKFQEIDWDQKYNELNSGAINCIWNGFTANSKDTLPSGETLDRSELVDFSYGYMLNQQCVVVKKDKLAEITGAESLKGKTACVEGGSAGAAYAKTVTDKDNINDRASAQVDALFEVRTGAAYFAVVDILLAKNLCGKGEYENLAIVESIVLDHEIYAIGFKKGSDLTEKVNKAIKQLEENGTLLALAKEYGLENVFQITEKID